MTHIAPLAGALHLFVCIFNPSAYWKCSWIGQVWKTFYKKEPWDAACVLLLHALWADRAVRHVLTLQGLRCKCQLMLSQEYLPAKQTGRRVYKRLSKQNHPIKPAPNLSASMVHGGESHHSQTIQAPVFLQKQSLQHMVELKQVGGDSHPCALKH